MFKNILLAVDGSEQSMMSARIAGNLARTLNAKLVVVTAFDPIPSIIGDPDRQRIISAHISDAENDLAAAINEIGEFPGELQKEILEGPAAEAILNVADTRGNDLIVMGTHGRGRFAGFFLGSVSQKVVAHAPCPVMLVR